MPTNIFARVCVAVKFMSIPFSCIPSRNKAGGGFGDEQCWGGLWTPNEDFGCITSHAQSTAAAYFAVAVKSDVVYLIMVCLVPLLQSFETEQIGHTGLPTHLFAYACVEVKLMAILFSCIFCCNKAGGGFGDPNEDFGCITYMHIAQLPHISPHVLFLCSFCALLWSFCALLYSNVFSCALFVLFLSSFCALLYSNLFSCALFVLFLCSFVLFLCFFVFKCILMCSFCALFVLFLCSFCALLFSNAEVLGMSSAGWVYGPPMKTLAVLHHMHRARLQHIRCCGEI